ncbi:unnamed protein product [Urochloa decumbens]|uniref:KIB1-4 beta-propeller domain-containing protein n=1 Tax=Urochloa decumbens TaxID=240449 RepID=A0ABC8W9Q5_9POAL
MPRRRKTSAAWRPWADLPPELLREIYGRLVFARDLVLFQAACRPWRDAVAADRPLRFPPWADLPVEARRNICNRLHMASDSVRFHAVCHGWKAALDDGDPPGGRLLPWLLAPSSAATVDEAEDQRCRCVFSKATYRAPGICFRDRRVAYPDGTAAWLVRCRKKTFLVNPLTAQRLCRVNDWWLDYRHRIVCNADSALLYDLFGRRNKFKASFIHAAALGDAWFDVSSRLSTSRCCAAACHKGGYAVCVDLVNCHVLRPSPEQEDEYNCGSDTTREVRAALPEEPADKVRRCSYLLEYRGELLLASVLRDRRAGGRLSVSLHELRLGAGLNGIEEPEVRWVSRDQSDSDMSLMEQEVFFLGFPNSFAVEAAEFGGEVSGGAAYFVIEDDNSAGGQGRARSTAAEPTCSVYRYGFRDDATTLVERLPAGWHDARCMWFLPKPHIPPYPLEDDEEDSESRRALMTTCKAMAMATVLGDSG